MTKKFDFNWRIPVPEPLLQGNSFDKWTEVSWKTFDLFFVVFVFFESKNIIADVSARRNCKTSTYIKGGRKSKKSRTEVIDFFFSFLPPGAPYTHIVIANFFPTFFCFNLFSTVSFLPLFPRIDLILIFFSSFPKIDTISLSQNWIIDCV